MSSAASDPRIRVLPPQVANQIAAGEVVERPSSVVKELLENSLDAGAHTIDLDVEKGGVQRILLRDDGHGIYRDDLLLALSPHATSKIASAEDLEGVGSLGFRGEALASIASVSRLALKSRRSEEASGWQLLGGELEPTPAALMAGTEIEVCDLFYNTPARRKFLRSERTELLHVEEVVRRIALSRFDLALRFSHNGKSLLRLKAASLAAERQRRIVEVLGKPFHDNTIEFDVAAEGLRLWGWLGHSDYSRSHADSQYVYLNGRMIRDRLVSHAIRLAFGERIPEGRFPAYLLYLELEPRLVDVNVHPTKHEVRFREARQVHDFIYWAINGALRDRPSEEPVETATDNLPRTPPFATAQYQGGSLPRHVSYKTPLHSAVSEVRGRYVADTKSLQDETGAPLLGRAVAQLRSGYLISERNDDTLLVDLRALLSGLYLARLATPLRSELLTPQPLLIPCSIPVSAEMAQLWRRHDAPLLVWGFEWGWLGDELLVIRQVPALLRHASMEQVAKDVGEWLRTLPAEEGVAELAMLQLLSRQALPEPLPSYGLGELNNLLREYEQRCAGGTSRPWRIVGASEWPRLFALLP